MTLSADGFTVTAHFSGIRPGAACGVAPFDGRVFDAWQVDTLLKTQMHMGAIINTHSASVTAERSAFDVTIDLATKGPGPYVVSAGCFMPESPFIQTAHTAAEFDLPTAPTAAHGGQSAPGDVFGSLSN